MIVKEVAFGNEVEAYIENKLTNKVNIIFSNDNNKGKTLVMQGLMFSIGYESIFPSTFNYKEYYFYSKIEISGIIYEFLRKKNHFIVKENNLLHFFDSVTDYKYYFSKNIIKLPYIQKDKRRKMVDLSLFFEIFFIGQDERSPSSLISKGQFNKKDFESMIYSYMNLSEEENETNLEEIKEKLKGLKAKKTLLLKKLKLKKNNPKISEQVSRSIDNDNWKQTEKRIKELNQSISNEKRQRTRELNRKSKLEVLLGELNSLNRKLEAGEVKCAECGSHKILYSNNEFNFEVSDLYIRNEIINSIKENIEQKEELILEYTDNINSIQEILNKEFDSTSPEIKDMLIFKDDILSERDIDDDLFQVIKDIDYWSESQSKINDKTNNNKEKTRELLIKILEEMSSKYHAINPSGNLTFDNLFAKKDATFSGSESQEYYFSKLLALNNVLDHEFPLLVDSFRDGELSSDKEKKMLTFYKNLDKQVILTATLKEEEYGSDKYLDDEELNVLDYSNNPDSHILQEQYSSQFIEIIQSFKVRM